MKDGVKVEPSNVIPFHAPRRIGTPRPMQDAYHVEYRVDHEAGVSYVALPPGGEIARTIRISDDVMIDVNADGELCGIELLRLEWRR